MRLINRSTYTENDNQSGVAPICNIMLFRTQVKGFELIFADTRHTDVTLNTKLFFRIPF